MVKGVYGYNGNVKPNTCLQEKLKRDFTGFFNEAGEFDFDTFKKKLSDEKIEFYKEGYEMNFLGNSYARLQTALETISVITPDVEHKNTINVLLVNDGMFLSKATMEKSDYDQTLLGNYTQPYRALEETKSIVIIDEPHRFKRDNKVYISVF